MKLRILKEIILKEIITPLQEPSELDRDVLSISKWALRITCVSILISVVGIILIVLQIKTSADKGQFENLLSKTDTLITNDIAQSKISDSLLHLNLEIAKANDVANKYRFIAAVIRLGATMDNKDNVINRFKENDPRYTHAYIEGVCTVLEEQLNNPFLCHDTTMLKVWVNADFHMNIAGYDEQYLVNNNGSILLDNNGKTLLNNPPHILIDEISPIEMKRGMSHAWDAVHEAYLYCGKKLEVDISHFVKK